MLMQMIALANYQKTEVFLTFFYPDCPC